MKTTTMFVLACAMIVFVACIPGAAVVPITDLGACIATRIARDTQVQPPMTDAQITVDVASYCGTDALTVAVSLAKMHAAIVKASAQ